MDTAERIRQSVTAVEQLRSQCRSAPELSVMLGAVKRFQGRRFAGTYADLLAAGPYAKAARFFLEELYGDRDFAERDAQFARIAGAVEKLFPRDVAEAAAAIAELHALTESLDHAVALASRGCERIEPVGYLQAWRQVGRRPDRETQLRRVLTVGGELLRLTRVPALRLMLRMMRAPANLAGLGALQGTLERGFDTFAAVARAPEGAEGFLAHIEQREQNMLALLFESRSEECAGELARVLAQGR